MDDKVHITTDVEFIQLVSLAASQAGCMVDLIEGKTININCPEGREQEEQCAYAIEEATKNVVFDKER